VNDDEEVNDSLSEFVKFCEQKCINLVMLNLCLFYSLISSQAASEKKTGNPFGLPAFITLFLLVKASC